MRPNYKPTTTQLLLGFLAAAAAPVTARIQAGAAAAPVPHDRRLLFPDSNPFSPPPPAAPPLPADQTSFSLRQIYHHGTYRDPQLHVKKDVFPSNSKIFLAAEDGSPDQEIPPLRVKSRKEVIQRLVDRRPSVVDPMVAESRRQGGLVSVFSPSAWTMDEVIGPDITDKETVLSLAIMASDAYVEKEGEGNWEEVGGFYNRTADFGWQTDGLRGHLWTSDSNSTIVIGLKGTSAAVFDGDGTTTNDKINDNLFFSCCCAQQGQWSWHKVCDCASGSYQCNITCVTQALNQEHRYYTAAKELYSNVTERFPDANVWLTGHSLGGAIASFLGLTYGLPTVTFEAVPEALPAYRLGLPVPPGSDPQTPQNRQFTGTYHFGHTADPVYMGTCTGATATCSFAGYALETTCHTGSECVYDVVADKGWRVGIGTHKIISVIHNVIMKYDDVPECKPNIGCSDCAKWTFYESNGTETSTSTTSVPTSSSKTRTRTATCQTPGWWGCLDETTTTTAPETSTTSTSTCETPGWFGCYDKTTATTTTSDESTSTTTTTTTTTTCETPGRFWGCYDTTDELATSTTTSTQSQTAIPVPSITAPITATSTSTPTPTPTPPDSDGPTDDEPAKRHCVRRSWLGKCQEWEADGEDNDEDGKFEEM